MEVPLSADSARSAFKDGRQALGAAVAYLLFWLIVPRIKSSDIGIVLTTTLLSLLLVLYFTVRTARALRSPTVAALNLLLAIVVGAPVALVPLLHRASPLWPGWQTLHPAWLAYLTPFRRVPGLRELVLMWLATCLGVWISRLVREFKLLLPMAVALAAVDLYVVFGGGLVTQANSGTAPVARAARDALSLSLPKTGAAPLTLTIGFADFLFIALFFACFARFGIPSRRTFAVLYGVLAAYMLIVFQGGIDLPALVPIAVVVIGMNFRRFHYERSEAFALLYAGLILLAAAFGFYFFSHR
jgi:hypothetical protein